jgi:hypothetical protein
MAHQDNRLADKSDGYNGNYSGWANYATWNVALWISNDEGLYHCARAYRHSRTPYQSFVGDMRELGSVETPDHVAYNDRSLDTEELDDMIRGL